MKDNTNFKNLANNADSNTKISDSTYTTSYNEKINSSSETNVDIPAILALSIPIISVVALTILFGYRQKLRHQVKLKMIEKGINPIDEKNTNFLPPLNISRKKSPLKLIGIGVGLLLGYLLKRFFDMGIIGYASMLLICIAIAIILDEKMNRNKN